MNKQENGKWNINVDLRSSLVHETTAEFFQILIDLRSVDIERDPGVLLHKTVLTDGECAVAAKQL